MATATFVLLFCAAAALLFYDHNIFALGWQLVPITAVLTIFGSAIGFVAASITMRYGQVREIAFALCWVVVPFSGAYYSFHDLPNWAQKIGNLLPLPYVFGIARGDQWALSMGSWRMLVSLLMSLGYLALGIMLFWRALEKKRENGFAA